MNLMAEVDELPDSDSSWIVENKFVPSRPNIDLVDRGRLISVLDSAVKRKLALVVAPAGFGKSTVLYQWFEDLASNDVKVSWLSLDEADSEVRQFLAYCTIALANVGVDMAALEIAARNGFAESQPSRLVSSILRQIQSSKENQILILDDYHRASSPEVDAIVQQMIREMPKNLTLCINSRFAPDLDLPMLVASGEAVEIGPDQLRLTPSEVAAALGDNIAFQDTKEIIEQTEGWPVAVQLAKVQKQAQPLISLKNMGPSGLVASYLTDQVLASVDEDVSNFLLTVSVLEQFNPSLANAVGAAANSIEILQRLEPLNALLIPTDTSNDWRRLHHLFAEYLLETLRKTDSDRIVEIQKSASDWFEKKGYLIESVRYASIAGDDARCERLILDAGGWKIILTEGIGVMRTLLRLAPDHVISGSGRLMIARAYLCCKEGQYHEARGLMDASEALRQEADGAAYDKDHRVVEAMILGYEDQEDWALNLANQDFCPDPAEWSNLEAGTLLCESVMALFSIGDLSAVHRKLDLAFSEMRSSGSVLGLNYCYIHAGNVALYSGSFDLASANISQAVELADNNFGSDSGLKHLSEVAAYAIKIWKGLASEEDIEPFSQTLLQVEESDGWAEIYLLGLDAAFQLCEQVGNYSFASEFVRRFSYLAKNRNLERLQNLCRILEMRLAHLRGNTASAELIAKEIQDEMLPLNFEQNLRGWQGYYHASIALCTSRLMSGGIGINSLHQCQLDAQAKGTYLYDIRLRVAEAILIRQSGRKNDSAEILIGAIKIAAPQKIMGPFLGDDSLKKILKDARVLLRGEENQLILVNFISEILSRLEKLKPQTGSEIMSAREQEILEQLAQGQSNKEIARRFELTENTVKFHLKNIYAKLAVNRRTQAIAAAHKLKLLE